MTWIDSHIHAWEQGDDIWIRSRVGALAGAFPLPVLREIATRNGVSNVILVQAAQTSAETLRCTAMAARDAFVAGVVGWIDLHSPRLGAEVAKLRSCPGLVGFRPLPMDTFGAGWWKQPQSIAGLKTLAASASVVDILAASAELPDVANAISRSEGLRAVLNHGGRPKVMCGEIHQWRARLHTVAKSGDVYCKCSGLVERAGIEWTFAAIFPYVGTLLDAFGPERLIFASNWPVLNIASNYQNWINSVLEAFVRLGLHQSQIDAVMGGNAALCYALSDSR